MTIISHYARGLVHHRSIVAVVVASGLGVAVTSRDWFMTPVAAATMAGLAVVFLQRVWRSHPWSGWRHVRTAQVLSVVAVPVAFSTGLSVNENHLFREAFDAASPANVHNLVVDANLLNPAGKRTVLMRFNADPISLQAFLETHGFGRDRQMEEALTSGEAWNDTVHQAFGDFAEFGGPAWSPFPEMAAPHYRDRIHTEGGSRCSTRVLWNGHTGNAFVLYTVR